MPGSTVLYLLKSFLKEETGTMQNAHSSVWLLKGFLVAALLSCGTLVAAAEPEVKKENAAAAASSSAPVAVQGAVARVNGTAIDAVELRVAQKVLREYTRRDLLISRFVETTFVSKAAVSEAEIRSFYDNNQDKFKRDESVKASHILIGVDSAASAEDKKKAREKAEKLRKDLAGGAEFAALAKEYSTCPSSKQGGDLGFFGKGQMVPSLEKAAFALKTGEISNVVETQFGYHVIKLKEKKPAVTTDFNEVKAKIEEFLKGQKVNEAIQKYLAETKKTAKIEILMK